MTKQHKKDLHQARHSDDRETLLLLSEHSCWIIREAVAMNPFTDENILDSLTKDKRSYRVRFSALYNDNTLQESISNASYDDRFEILEVVLKKTNDEYVLRYLFNQYPALHNQFKYRGLETLPEDLYLYFKQKNEQFLRDVALGIWDEIPF